MLRKRDHTGIVLVPDGAWPSGHHRLAITYARAGVGGLPDQSEQGDTAPELAIIDLFPRRS